MNNYLLKQKVLFAFNIWDIYSAKAVMTAAAKKGKNVILQTSASIFEKTEKRLLSEFVKSYAKEMGIEAWLHLDHCREEGIIQQAIMFGWDSVMIDASHKLIRENIEITNRIVKYAHERNVLVEAEIGQVNGVEDGIICNNTNTASKEEIDLFCSSTNVDMIAVAFGNAHGKYKGDPKLNFDLVEYTAQKFGIPFVVHGASGLSKEILERLISIEGVKKINVSTEVKLAYRDGLLKAYQKGLFEETGFQAVNISKVIQETISDMVYNKLMIFEEQ